MGRPEAPEAAPYYFGYIDQLTQPQGDTREVGHRFAFRDSGLLEGFETALPNYDPAGAPIDDLPIEHCRRLAGCGLEWQSDNSFTVRALAYCALKD